MSEDNKFVDPLHAKIEEGALEERKRKEVLKKELVIRERKADYTLTRIEQNDRDAEIAKSTDYGMLTEEDILQQQKDNTDYMLAARNKMPFINTAFDKAIPFFRKNLILVGGKTGEGKSTTVANIIREIVGTRDPVTKKLNKVLVLTNEEKSEDVYNRVTCLLKGWHYVNHDQFTDEQVTTFNNYIAGLSKVITVVDNTYRGSIGTTTTLEGICQIFDNIIAKWKTTGEHYECVLLDYYQNVRSSRLNPELNEYQVQAALARRLDVYKNIYPAPIIVLAQVRPPDAENTVPFKIRVEGSKEISNVATCIVEMVANREELSTDWTIHKSRFNEKVGDTVTTGYDKGRYVLHSEEFKQTVAVMKAARANAALNKSIGHMPTIIEGEGNE